MFILIFSFSINGSFFLLIIVIFCYYNLEAVAASFLSPPDGLLLLVTIFKAGS